MAEAPRFPPSVKMRDRDRMTVSGGMKGQDTVLKCHMRIPDAVILSPTADRQSISSFLSLREFLDTCHILRLTKQATILPKDGTTWPQAFSSCSRSVPLDSWSMQVCVCV